MFQNLIGMLGRMLSGTTVAAGTEFQNLIGMLGRRSSNLINKIYINCHLVSLLFLIPCKA